MHLEVVKVGLLWLAKLDVINPRLISAKRNSKNFDNPNIYLHLTSSEGLSSMLSNTLLN